MISEFAICNPMSRTSRNYINVLYYNRESNIHRSILKWTERREELYHTSLTLHELIKIRDGYQELMYWIYIHFEICVILNMSVH